MPRHGFARHPDIVCNRPSSAMQAGLPLAATAARARFDRRIIAARRPPGHQ